MLSLFLPLSSPLHNYLHLIYTTRNLVRDPPEPLSIEIESTERALREGARLKQARDDDRRRQAVDDAQSPSSFAECAAAAWFLSRSRQPEDR